MSIEPSREAVGRQVLRKYKTRGLYGGLGLGLFVGILLSGPHFDEWSAGLSLAVICGSSLSCAVMGWLFASAVSGSVGSGPDYGDKSDEAGGGDGGGESSASS